MSWYADVDGDGVGEFGKYWNMESGLRERPLRLETVEEGLYGFERLSLDFVVDLAATEKKAAMFLKASGGGHAACGVQHVAVRLEEQFCG
jgi:hypothetical protein